MYCSLHLVMHYIGAFWVLPFSFRFWDLSQSFSDDTYNSISSAAFTKIFFFLSCQDDRILRVYFNLLADQGGFMDHFKGQLDCVLINIHVGIVSRGCSFILATYSYQSIHGIAFDVLKHCAFIDEQS